MAPHALGDEPRRRSSSMKTPFPMSEYTKNQAYMSEAIEDYDHDGSRGANGHINGTPTGESYTGRVSFGQERWNGSSNGAARKGRHGRQKSLSEALKTVRTRKSSISESAHEIADSLRAPISYKVVAGCVIWYATSILTNTSSKAILTAFNKPITLTVVQFMLVCFWCIFLSWAARHSPALREFAPVLKGGIRRPTMEIIYATLPLTAFQVGGHILNSDAMARIPVSLVHTIKGLSPLMTVVAYRVFYDIRYSIPIYLSLVPLTIGVFMACAANTTSNLIGLAYAFGSAILFVTQNIVSKQIFNEAARAEADGSPLSRRKPDKLNLLCYSSGMAFCVTAPIWLFSEGFGLMREYMNSSAITLNESAMGRGALLAEFIFNGTFHFGQSLVAFILLGMVSPVTYSVASLIKRVAVIMFAIIWFGSPMTYIQGFGFGLTFLGLYLYDRTSDAAKADKLAKEMGESAQPLLPLDVNNTKRNEGMISSPVSVDPNARPLAGSSGFANGDNHGPGRPRGSAQNSPSRGTPGTFSFPPKAEDIRRLDGTGS
ncbi:hypothetical protein AMS68_007312 [Peltaster fructicola]|uniref:Sugar phosphate transporter domain-containing protein n=1 Tax=Peltaster fructicola TaxID=286661 RepID=A0A6H0Y4E2_9PEZI|nr:hypothetical protein AMS68_007312 [Peltaster fructicola]